MGETFAASKDGAEYDNPTAAAVLAASKVSGVNEVEVWAAGGGGR